MPSPEYAQLLGLYGPQWVEVGGSPIRDLISELRAGGVHISSEAESLTQSWNFKLLPRPETIALIQPRVSSLGFSHPTEEREITQRAHAIGLEDCPPETPFYMLREALLAGDPYRDKPDFHKIIGMEPIIVRRGYTYVFNLAHLDGRQFWLYSHWAAPAYYCHPGNRFVFRLRE